MINRFIPSVIFAVLFLCPVFASAQSVTMPLHWDILAQREQDSNISFRGIAAVSKNEAWVSGNKGRIYHTSDGGASWASVSVNDSLDFRDIELLPDGSLIAMSAGPGGLSGVYQSVNNGISWKLTNQNTSSEAFYNGMAFHDSQLGYLVGDPVNNHLFVLQTLDGGRNWQRVRSTKLPGPVPGEYGFAASGTGIINWEQNFWMVTGGSTARIIHFSVRSDEWHAGTLPLLSGNSSSGAFSVAFADDQNGVVVGGDYASPEKKGKTVAYTRDGGKSWKLAENHKEIGYHSCVVYSAALNIYVAVSRSGKSIYSQDGGISWSDFGTIKLYSLSVSEDGTVWGAGPKGTIARLKTK
mgnify:FL=1